MAWHMQIRRRMSFAPLLGTALLAAAVLIVWQFAPPPADASSAVPPYSGAARIADAQVNSKADHTCTTSGLKTAGSKFRGTSQVTANEDLSGVYVQFELISENRAHSAIANSSGSHQKMKKGDVRTFSVDTLTIFPGDDWVFKCTVRADVKIPIVGLIADKTVSETKETYFDIGALERDDAKAWLRSCGPQTVPTTSESSIRLLALGLAEGAETSAEKALYETYFFIYKDGELIQESQGSRIVGAVDPDPGPDKEQAQPAETAVNFERAFVPDSTGNYGVECYLISKNQNVNLMDKVNRVHSCQTVHIPFLVAKCISIVAIETEGSDLGTKRVWGGYVLSWVASSTFCVGDETDCPGTSTSPGTTTTPPPTEETTPEPAPVTPVPAPEPPPAPPAPAPPRSSDRAALIALYNGTGGARWINNLQSRETWQIGNSNSDIDDWYGVATHENGRVKYLRLEFDNNLHGSLPSLLGNLTQALVLSISGNERDGRSLQGVRGSIPEELGNLTALQGLYLHDNELSGGIPEALGNLTALQELYLRDNQLSGGIPEALGNLAELDALDLSGNRLSGNIPAALGNLANLRDLDLSGNRLDGEIPAAVANLTDLESLFLSGGSNDFTGCVPSRLRRVDDHDLDQLGIPFCDVALGGLAVSPGQLDEPFDGTRAAFAATVYQSRITITPSAVESGSFEILDDDGNPIADADTVASGHQVDLTSDDESIRVMLVSSDGRRRRTYTLDLTVARPTAPGAPTIGAVTARGASLLVPWSAATGSGASAATAYNLRHIRSDATDKADANWTVSTVSASPDSRAMSYWLQDLEPDTSYDLEVQAVNDAGASPWSASATATTGAAISVSLVRCSPYRPVQGATVSCTPTVVGGVRSDDSYAWWASGSSTETGSAETFTTSWDSAGAKRVAVEVCSAGHCAGKERRVIVVDTNPNLVWDYARPPAEIALGESIDLQFGITKKSWVGGPGGISVSFPRLTAPAPAAMRPLISPSRGPLQPSAIPGAISRSSTMIAAAVQSRIPTAPEADRNTCWLPPTIVAGRPRGSGPQIIEPSS